MTAGRRVGLGLAVALAVALAGCEEPPPPTPPAEPAPALWEQARDALDAGEFERAAGLFAQALEAREPGSPGRSDAALALALAGRVDLAQGLLVDGARGEADPQALAAALEIFRHQPPPGQADNPLVVPAMAEAIRAFRQTTGPPQPQSPVKFTGADLAELLRHWQAWHRLAALEAERAPGAGPARAIALWAFLPDEAALVSGDLLLVHPAGRGLWDLAHLGSWPLSETGSASDVARLADASGQRGAVLVMQVSHGEVLVSTMRLHGQLTGDSFVVNATTEPALYGALLATLADGALREGEVALPVRAQREALLDLAGRLGRLDRLAVEGGQIRLAGEWGGTDYADTGQWLTELGSYVLHGRALGAMLLENDSYTPAGTFPIQSPGSPDR